MKTGINKLIIIGNGFDLAHGLKTSYKNFLDWYFVNSYKNYCSNRIYDDNLLSLKPLASYNTLRYSDQILHLEDVLSQFRGNTGHVIKYKSDFFNSLVGSFQNKNWVDIEREYFNLLRQYFSQVSVSDYRSIEAEGSIKTLNSDFNFLTNKLAEYISCINLQLPILQSIDIEDRNSNIQKGFDNPEKYDQVKLLNFNYTDTLYEKGYGNEHNIISIHGRVSDIDRNPIIFGYGDETDPAYQKIEDSGNNLFLEHIKSFGYFKTGNYHKLLSFIDSQSYEVVIIGHSCGLSDRILLNTVFEHANCRSIEIFYHRRADGNNNFKEITQEISRHFRPQNKSKMREKIIDYNPNNYIPQNIQSSIS